MTADAPPTEPTFWDRARPWWHVAVGLDLAATALLATFDDLGDRYWLLLGGLVVIGLLYTLVGRHQLTGGTIVQTGLYLVPAWAVFLGVAHLTNTAQVLLFVLFPQSWAMLPKIAAAATSVCAMGSMVVLRLTAGDNAGIAVLDAGVNLTLSLMLGYWVYGIAEESERRRALAQELQQTRAELAEMAHRAGMLAERQRLSQEIHDTLAQGFTSLLTLAQAAEAGLAPGDDAVRERLRLMQRTARQNLTEARALIAALAPADLAGADLGEALRRVCDRLAAEHSVRVLLEVCGPPAPLTRNADVVVVRAVQEALANVGRHASARAVAVRLEYRAEGGVRLTVTDDGCGLAADAVEGFGIAGMRARAADVGGQLDVLGSPDGTVVRLELP
ncbi:MAG TPA: sensor histidine kinase [Jatrophihabitantaceae bacterium]|nr:sensor histidine kinase [Jatrophihabitantaceae bacterium]